MGSTVCCLNRKAIKVAPTRTQSYNNIWQKYHNILHKSWNLICQEKVANGVLVFINMVKLSPGIKMYFQSIDFDKDESCLANNTFLQNHATRFMEAIDVIILHDMDINTIGSYLRAVGSKHYSYNLKVEHVQSISEAFIQMARTALKKKFTQATEDAWASFFQMVTDLITDGIMKAQIQK